MDETLVLGLLKGFYEHIFTFIFSIYLYFLYVEFVSVSKILASFTGAYVRNLSVSMVPSD